MACAPQKAAEFRFRCVVIRAPVDESSALSMKFSSLRGYYQQSAPPTRAIVVTASACDAIADLTKGIKGYLPDRIILSKNLQPASSLNSTHLLSLINKTQAVMFSLISKSTIFVLSLASLSLAAPAARQSGTFTGSATFYNTGLGACGITNNDSDLIAAVPASLFDSVSTGNPNTNPFCNKQLRVSFNGITQTVTVTDRCAGCGPSDLDLSPAAFQKFSSLDAGRLNGVTWTIL